ncbi:THAP domain-containing protein 2-like isoform X2 [Zophobas morio]|uniref:THAP domain-containing protein 2-like isoform X2 n=1 Tax=Zophobas morio TaxID=2755281 RepID=UPI003083D63A
MPGTICSIASCKNNYLRAKKEGKPITFFNFPKDPEIRAEWVRRCKRDDKFHPKYKRVCSKHFVEEDYKDIIKAKVMNVPPKKLRATAVPSLYLPEEESVSDDYQNMAETHNINILPIKLEATDGAAIIKTIPEKNATEKKIFEFKNEIVPDFCSTSQEIEVLPFY